MYFHQRQKRIPTKPSYFQRYNTTDFFRRYGWRPTFFLILWKYLTFSLFGKVGPTHVEAGSNLYVQQHHNIIWNNFLKKLFLKTVNPVNKHIC